MPREIMGAFAGVQTQAWQESTNNKSDTLATVPGSIYFRFIEIIDSVLPYLVPAWEYSIGSYSSLEVRYQ